MCMKQLDPRTDAELVALAIEGDQGAFAAMYDRYADRLHSYCFVMLRDPHAAADATHDTFVKAATRLSQLRDPAKLRPWLFAIARNEAHAEGRKRAKQDLVDDLSQDLVADPDPSLGLAQAELKELVWTAVAGLQDRDRDLMTLHLVEGLEGAELAQAMGVKDSHLHVMLSRMRDRVEKALGALLIARQGRDDCDDLASLLEGWDGHFNLDIRSKVTRHVESCDICSANRALLVSPAALLPSVVFIPAPESLRGAVLADAAPALAASSAGSGTGGGSGWKIALASVAAVIVVAVGGVAVSQVIADADAEPAAAPVSLTSSTSTTVLPFVEPPPTTTEPPVLPPPVEEPPPVAPAALSISSDSVDFSTDGLQTTLWLTNVGGVATDWTGSAAADGFVVDPLAGSLDPGQSAFVTVSVDRSGAPEGELSGVVAFTEPGSSSAEVDLSAAIERPPVIRRPSAQPAFVYVVDGSTCGSQVAVISAIVTDESPLVSVALVWGVAGGTENTTQMTFEGNNVFEGVVGPFEITGDVSPRIVAVDSRGNAASTSAQLASVSCF